MDELNLTRQQRYTAVRIAPLRSVFQVTFDWAAYLCQFAAYLVVATGHQLNLDKRVSFLMAYYLIV